MKRRDVGEGRGGREWEGGKEERRKEGKEGKRGLRGK